MIRTYLFFHIFIRIMKDILEVLKKAIEEASGYGQPVVIFPLIDARILVEDIKLILSDAISHPHWDKNGYLDVPV